MSTLNVTIPASVRDRVEHFAKEDGVSVDDFVASVLSQRIAVADADSYMRQRAKKGSADKLIKMLAKAPDVQPQPCDQLTKSGEQDGAENGESR